MKVVASTDEYTIYLRRDGRHAVKGADKSPINGAEKVSILLQHNLITAAPPKAEPAPEEAADAAEDAADDAADEVSDEASGQEGAAEEESADD